MDGSLTIEGETKEFLEGTKNHMGNRRRKVGVSNFFNNPKDIMEVSSPLKGSGRVPNCGDCLGEVQMIEEGPNERCIENCILKNDNITSSSEVVIHRPPHRSAAKTNEGWNPYGYDAEEHIENEITNNSANFFDFCKNRMECHRCSKPEILNWIGQHVNQVRNNTRVVRDKINSVFDELIKTCEERRHQLLNQVSDIEGKKIESLKRVHDACMSSEKLDNSFIENFCSLDFSASFQVDDSKSSLKARPESKYKFPPSPKNDQTLSSENGGLPTTTSEFQDKLDLMTFQFPTLEEGNLVFQEEQSLSSKILSFGNLNEALASPDLTIISGLGLKYGFVGEEASFEVRSRSKTGDVSVLTSEILNVTILSPDKSELECFMSQDTVSFTPVIAGEHSIHVAVNGVEIPGSPATCRVYEKEALIFDISPKSPTNIIKKDSNGKLISSGSKRELENEDAGDDTNGEVSGIEYPLANADWTLQKGETSALLSTVGDPGALLYASVGFQTGTHAWKIRVTSACLSVNLFMGVSTRTENYDLDTDSACNFGLASPPLQRTSQTFFSTHRRRKVSIFERYSVTFCVIADLTSRELKVINSDTMEVKLKNIPLSYSVMYPTIFMSHNCKNSVCPRPQVAFS